MKKKAATTEAAPAKVERTITIKPPNMRVIKVRIEGTAPYLQHAFSPGVVEDIRKGQAAGSTGKKGKKREPRDFDANFRAAQHRAGGDGWYGIPAAAFRCACIDACRVAGFKMTIAKMSVFILADGYNGMTPLVKLDAGEPEMTVMQARNANGGMDLRSRPAWKEWGAVLRVRFDADQFTDTDVVNLLSIAGEQVGVGEGRPYSKMSAGCGWGTFQVVPGVQ